MGKGGKRGKRAERVQFPKKKCCESRTKCGRCPLRMLREGTLPDGYTVKRRRLVKLENVELLACHATKKKLKKSAAKRVDVKVKSKKAKSGKKAA